MKPALLFLLLAAQVPMFSQVGVSGLPWPHRHKKDQSKDAPIQRSRGQLTKVDEQSLVVDASDGRVLTFKRTEKTQFFREDKEIKPAQLRVGDRVTIDATEDTEGYLYAVKVSIDPNPPPEEGAAATPAATETAKGARGEGNSPSPVASDSTEPGPPKLRHGIPARRQDAEPEEDAAAPAPGASEETREAPETPEAPPTDDPIIDKAGQATVAFTEKLPNYVCKEFMARYQSSRQPADWEAIDVVSTDIVYEAGKESYRNIAVNGKAFQKGMEQMSGAWSTGEFGTMLLDLFAPWTAAEFRLRKRATVAGVETRVYDFDVDHQHSRWHILLASQSLRPAYKGSVWIEPATGKVLRLEMRARSLPERFPVDMVESAVDYDNVMIGGKKFLLPVHAETLACERGTSNCSRNVIDFRNYHKFESSSDITFAGDK